MTTAVVKRVVKPLDVRDLQSYTPFKFNYPMRKTQKAIMFNVGNKKTAWVPISMLRYDERCLYNNEGFIFISNMIRQSIIIEHAGVDLGI